MQNLETRCDRVSSDYLTVDTSNPAEVYLTMAFSREQPEVLLTDRTKVAAIRDALSAWLKDEPVVDLPFSDWYAEHGREGVKHELGLEDLMEGAYHAGAKSNRRAVRNDTPAPDSIATALRTADWSGVPIGNKALIEAAAQALNNGGSLPDTIHVTELSWGEPKRKLEIEGDRIDGYGAWMTDTDGNLHTVVTFSHPYEVADWCERNGFAWEVVGADDPVAGLAAWRAQQ